MPFQIYKGGRRPPHSDETHPRLWLDEFLRPEAVRGTAIAVPQDVDFCSAVTEFPMDLNDQLGDCGIAGMDHLQLAWSTYASGSATSWGDAVCQSLYQTLGDYVPGDPSTDNGTVLQDNLTWWRRNEINGTKLLAFGALRRWGRPNRVLALRNFGAGYIGLNLQEAQEMQFPDQPWHWVPGGEQAGGHCTTHAAEFHTTDEIRLPTWGGVAKANKSFLMEACEEYWVAIFPGFIEKTGRNPSGIDLEGMNEALTSLTGESNPLQIPSRLL